MEARTQVSRVGVEQNARVEGDFDAFAYALNFGILHVFLQLGRLLVHFAADEGTGRAAGSSTNNGTDGRALAAAQQAAYHAAQYGTTASAQQAAFCSFAHTGFTGAGAIVCRKVGLRAAGLLRSGTRAE